MRVLVWEGRYGVQILVPQKKGLSSLFSSRPSTARASTHWGEKDSGADPLILSGYHEQLRQRKVIVVLRQARPPMSYSGVGLFRIGAANLGGVKYEFGIDTVEKDVLVESIRSLSGFPPKAIIPAHLALLSYYKDHPEVAALRRGGHSIGFIDVGFHYTVFVGERGKVSQREYFFHMEPYGVYDAVDHYHISTGKSFREARGDFLKGHHDYVKEIYTSLVQGVIFSEASFLLGAKKIFLSGVSLVPAAGEVQEKKDQENLTPYGLFAVAIEELGRVGEVVPGSHLKDHPTSNEHVVLLGGYELIKRKRR